MNSQAISADSVGDGSDFSPPSRTGGIGHGERFLVVEYRLTRLEQDIQQLATKSDLMALQLAIMERFGEQKSRLDKIEAERAHMASKTDVQDAKISLLRWGLGALLSFLAGWSLIIKYFILP